MIPCWKQDRGAVLRGGVVMRFRSVTNALLVSSALGLTLGLSGCGITYVSPSVSNRAEGLDVRVLPITAENVLLANRAPYAPRTLPDAFSQTAGAGSPRASARRAAAPRAHPGTRA